MHVGPGYAPVGGLPHIVQAVGSVETADHVERAAEVCSCRAEDDFAGGWIHGNLVGETGGRSTAML